MTVVRCHYQVQLLLRRDRPVGDAGGDGGDALASLGLREAGHHAFEAAAWREDAWVHPGLRREGEAHVARRGALRTLATRAQPAASVLVCVV